MARFQQCLGTWSGFSDSESASSKKCTKVAERWSSRRSLLCAMPHYLHNSNHTHLFSKFCGRGCVNDSQRLFKLPQLQGKERIRAANRATPACSLRYESDPLIKSCIPTTSQRVSTNRSSRGTFVFLTTSNRVLCTLSSSSDSLGIAKVLGCAMASFVKAAM